MENNSRRPLTIHEKLGKYWIYLTNMRLIFYPLSNKEIISQELEEIDYYSYFEKEYYSEIQTPSFLAKNCIRIWVGLTRFDLIGKESIIKEIFQEFELRISLRLRKGAVIDPNLFEEIKSIASTTGISLAELLKNGIFSFIINTNGKHKKYVEYEYNWNFLSTSENSTKVILIPAMTRIENKEIESPKSFLRDLKEHLNKNKNTDEDGNETTTYRIPQNVALWLNNTKRTRLSLDLASTELFGERIK